MAADDALNGRRMADRSGSPTCGLSPSASCTNFVALSGNVADGLWHLVAVTVTRSVRVRSFIASGTFYVDGAPVGSFNPVSRGESLDNAAELWLGGKHATATDGIAFFPGCLDEVEIFKRALDASEIAAIAAGSGGKCKP